VTIETVRYAAPGWGLGELVLVDGRIAHHEPPRGPDTQVTECYLPRAPLQAGAEGQVTDCYLPIVERIRAYLAGARDDFADVELALPDWTPLQLGIYEALRSVPYGEVVTYGELAALAGRPRAPRAAGSFCAGNPFGLFVPCHRVVAAGGIGSYGSLGVGYKRRLLELEGVAL
jgi:methylated-DNA-[protein]-cysteine S-methyltransferase